MGNGPIPKRKKPLEISSGSVTVRIYVGKNRVNGVTYPQYTLVYHDGTSRLKRRFADLAKARREAKKTADSLSKGEHQMLQLTPADRAIYTQAVKALRPVGVPLNVAAKEYTTALKRLPSGTSLNEIVDFFIKRHPATLIPHTVRQVANEMLAAKRTAKLSSAYIEDLESRLNRFCRDFSMNIGSVTGAMIQKWLDTLNVSSWTKQNEGGSRRIQKNQIVSGRTKQNYLRVCASLFRFAIKRKYLPKDAYEEIEGVQNAKNHAGEIEIFTPGEMAELLASTRAEMIPFMIIAGFAGLRSAELQRLEWSEINLEDHHIEIKASKAKTAARRLAPITPNLAAWLKPYKKAGGKVIPYTSWWNQIPKVVTAVNDRRTQAAKAGGNAPTSVKKFAWKHNALRHSFCSYRLAAIKNAAQVALEAGNSPQIIFQHYRQLVTDAEATNWFSIMPP